MGIKGEGCSGTYIQDTWTKPKWGRIKGGKCRWLGGREWWWGEGRQLYLNNNEKM